MRSLAIIAVLSIVAPSLAQDGWVAYTPPVVYTQCPSGGCYREGWGIGMGGGVQIVRPQYVRPQYQQRPQYPQQPQPKYTPNPPQQLAPVKPVPAGPGEPGCAPDAPTNPAPAPDEKSLLGCQCKEKWAALDERLDAMEKAGANAIVQLSDKRFKGDVELKQRIDELAKQIDLDANDVDAMKNADPEKISRDKWIALLNIKECKCAPSPDVPAPPDVTHYVLVADQEASYMRRMGDYLRRAQESYSQIKVAPVPDFPIGEVPQLVAYQGGKPLGSFKGQYDVENALAFIAKGETPKP